MKMKKGLGFLSALLLSGAAQAKTKIVEVEVPEEGPRYRKIQVNFDSSITVELPHVYFAEAYRPLGTLAVIDGDLYRENLKNQAENTCLLFKWGQLVSFTYQTVALGGGQAVISIDGHGRVSGVVSGRGKAAGYLSSVTCRK